MKRGTGGLVTALIGLALHRDAVWIASAMTDRDVQVAEEHGGKRSRSRGRRRRVPRPLRGLRRRGLRPLLQHLREPDALVHPALLWDQSNAPDIRRHEVEASSFGYNVVNEDLAEAVLDEIDGSRSRS
jgi:trehalose 6-phosphate synthase